MLTYEGDAQPGQATGQAIDSDGGEWYAQRSYGAPLIPALQAWAAPR